MASNDSTLTLTYQLNKPAQQQALKGLQDLRAEVRNQAADIKKLSLTSSGLTNDYSKLSAKAVEARNNLIKGTAAMKEQITVADRLAKANADAANSGGGGSASGGGSTPRFGRPLTGIGSLLSSAGASDIGGPLAQLGKATSVFQEMQGVLADLIPVEEGAVAGELGMTAALGPLAIVVGVVAVGVVALNAALDAGRKATEAKIAAEKELADVVANGTTKDIEAAKVKAEQDYKAALFLKQQGDARVKDIASRYGSGTGSDFDKFLLKIVNPEGFAAAATEAEDATAAMNKAADSQALLTDQQRRGAGAAADAAAAEAARAKAAKDFAGEFSAGPSLASQIETNRANAAQSLAKMAQLRDTEQQAETDAVEKGAEQRTAIIQREQDAEAKAALDLKRANADIDKKLEQTKADDRKAFAREEEKAAKDHSEKLLQIQRDLASTSEDDIRNRDFAKLAADRRAAVQKTQDENRNYAEGKQQRQQDLKAKLADDDLAAKRERDQRRQAYNQQIADLRAAEQKDLAANDAATQKSLAQLQAKLDAQLKIEQAGYDRSLQLEQEEIDLRNKVLQGALSAMQAQQINSYFGSSTEQNKDIVQGVITGEGLKHRALGGPVMPGNRYLVNDGGGRESLTSGGRTIALPYGLGTFSPARSGRINAAGGGMSVNMPVTFNGVSRREIHQKMAAVERKLVDLAEGIG